MPVKPSPCASEPPVLELNDSDTEYHTGPIGPPPVLRRYPCRPSGGGWSDSEISESTDSSDTEAMPEASPVCEASPDAPEADAPAQAEASAGAALSAEAHAEVVRLVEDETIDLGSLQVSGVAAVLFGELAATMRASGVRGAENDFVVLPAVRNYLRQMRQNYLRVKVLSVADYNLLVTLATDLLALDVMVGADAETGERVSVLVYEARLVLEAFARTVEEVSTDSSAIDLETREKVAYDKYGSEIARLTWLTRDEVRARKQLMNWAARGMDLAAQSARCRDILSRTDAQDRKLYAPAEKR